jgi:hypothetical protein
MRRWSTRASPATRSRDSSKWVRTDLLALCPALFLDELRQSEEELLHDFPVALGVDVPRLYVIGPTNTLITYKIRASFGEGVARLDRDGLVLVAVKQEHGRVEFTCTLDLI